MNILPLRPATLIGALMVALLQTPSPPAQAQTTTTTGQNVSTNSQLANANTANALSTGTGTRTTGQQSSNSVNTDVICIQEMTATFCNVVGGPNTNGYGSPGRPARLAQPGQVAEADQVAGPDRQPRLHRAASGPTRRRSRPAAAFPRPTNCATEPTRAPSAKTRF